MYLKTEQLFRDILDAADRYIEALEIGRNILDVDSPSDLEEFSAAGRVQRMLNELAATVEAELPPKTETIPAKPPRSFPAKVPRTPSTVRPGRLRDNEVAPAPPVQDVVPADLRTVLDDRVDRLFANASADDEEYEE